MADPYFEFTVYIAVKRKVTVKVYRPQDTHKPIPRLTERGIRQNMPNEAMFRNLLNQLEVGHIEKPPRPTITLVSNNQMRIDSQPANAVFRNIQLQAGNRSYGVVTVQNGAELSMPAGRGHQLLKYIKEGLYLSYRSHTYFNIRVTIQVDDGKGYGPDKEIGHEGVQQYLNLLLQWQAERKRQIRRRQDSINSNKAKLAQFGYILSKILLAMEKLAVKQAGKSALKKVPLLSTVAGLGFGAWRLVHGDVVGACGEVASGVCANIPGIGTVGSIGIDAVLVGKDIVELREKYKLQKARVEAEAKETEEEIKRLQAELAELQKQDE